jgi:DNA modification methylase
VTGRVAEGVELVLDDHDVRLFRGDVNRVLSWHLGERLGGVPPWPVDAVITSPPYLDAREDVSSFGELDEYLAWAERWLRHLRQIVRPDGSLMLNVGRLHRDGVEIPLADELRRLACEGLAGEARWHLIDTVVWHKVNGGGGKSSPYLLDRHEYVLWLAASTGPYKGFDEARVPYSPATLERYERRWSTRGAAAKNVLGGASDGREAHPGGALPGSVFTCSVGAEKGIEHPTPMALDLAIHLVRLACPPGGLILDPFAGSGTTGLAARTLGRRAVLIELDDEHCAEAAGRLGQQALPLDAAAEEV